MLNTLKDNAGANHRPKRLGRGLGSGLGKTSGRGQKGQKARSGVSLNGYEGGQNPIYQKLPKRGFTNIFKRDVALLNLGQLQSYLESGRIDAKKPITTTLLKEVGLVRKTVDGVKILGKGELKMKVDIEVEWASASAQKEVEKQKGKLTLNPNAGKMKSVAKSPEKKVEEKSSEKTTEVPVEKKTVASKKITPNKQPTKTEK